MKNSELYRGWIITKRVNIGEPDSYLSDMHYTIRDASDEYGTREYVRNVNSAKELIKLYTDTCTN